MKFSTSNPFAAIIAATLVCASNSQAQTRTWDGGGGADQGWNKKQNWDGNANNDLLVGSDLIFGGILGLSPVNNFAADSSFASITFSNTAGAFDLTGARITLTGAVTNNDTDLQTVSMNLILSGASGSFNAASGSLLVGGVISGSNGLIKSGNNTLQLTNANSYTGTTTVSAGTLLANNTTGSATGTGAVSVEANGRLGGTGTITPTGINGINVTGVLAPGGSASPGNLTFNLGGTTGTIAMNSDPAADFEFDLGLSGVDIDNVGASDLITLVGAAAADFAFSGNTIDFLGTGTIGFYKLFDTSTNSSTTWTGLTVDGTGLITSGLAATNLTGSLTGNLIMGGNSLGGTSGDIYLHVVPEPSAALLGGIGVMFLLRRRRTA